MDSKFNTILKIFFVNIGCLLIIGIPIIGLLATWNFDLSNMKNTFTDLFDIGTKKGESYNFSVQTGEDSLLTDIVIEKSNDSVITQKINTAVLLRVNSVQIEGPIVYGQDGEEMLRQGFWLFPSTVLPGEKGISIIFGHRRYHLPPAKDTFYNLDKIKVNDSIEVMLENGVWLEYQVISTDIIDPNELESLISEQSDKYILKLVTCTPLGTDKQRLVITAVRTV